LSALESVSLPTPPLDIDIDATRLRNMVHRFGMTPHQVRSALQTLESKLDGSGDTPDLRLTFESASDSQLERS